MNIPSLIPCEKWRAKQLIKSIKRVVRWELEGSIGSGYLAHCSHPFFHDHSLRVFGVLLYAISEFCNTDFAGQVVYKPRVLPVSSEALMPITGILIPAADCVLLLHQLVIGPVTHCNLY